MEVKLNLKNKATIKAQIKPAERQKKGESMDFKIMLLTYKPKTATAWVEYKQEKKKWRGSWAIARQIVTEKGWELMV
ncbi:MAG: hypothetical protein QNL04_00465 [SAR324 cluster bacterium]|nr:hypothetical protein [SAR324 cluster bacterium]